jgi:tryptophan synthase alpha chain
MIEVGTPFSDPVADGPVIQAAAQRALASGVRVGDCFDLIAALRARNNQVPIGILTYANIVVARAGFMRDAAAAGADSLLIADVPALEAEPFAREMNKAGIEPVMIAAANTPDATLAKIARLSKAYTYCVSRSGITGTHTGGQFSPELVERLKSRRATADFWLRNLRARARSCGVSGGREGRYLRVGDRRSRFETRRRRNLCPVIESSYTERLGGGMN